MKIQVFKRFFYVVEKSNKNGTPSSLSRKLSRVPAMSSLEFSALFVRVVCSRVVRSRVAFTTCF